MKATRTAHNFIDLTNEKFGKWTVLERVQGTSRQARWRCQCVCGAVRDVQGAALRSGQSRQCRSCASKKGEDLSGARFGDWLVLERGEDGPHRAARWFCRCSCGSEVLVLVGNLRSGVSTKCRSCAGTELQSLTGQQFGRWHVIERTDNSPRGRVRWLCRCDCGVELKIVASYLTSGHTKGCADCRRLPDDEVTYAVIHGRLRRQRGPASNFTCISCDCTAEHWAYQHNAEDRERQQMWTFKGQDYLVPFSPDMAHYEPMCASCHSRLDNQKSKEHRDVTTSA